MLEVFLALYTRIRISEGFTIRVYNHFPLNPLRLAFEVRYKNNNCDVGINYLKYSDTYECRLMVSGADNTVIYCDTVAEVGEAFSNFLNIIKGLA
jgi:hypothetical protein